MDLLYKSYVWAGGKKIHMKLTDFKGFLAAYLLP